MKPIFEPGDFLDLDCNHGQLHSTVIAQAARLAEAKLSSLGIDAETAEKVKELEQRVIDWQERWKSAAKRSAELERMIAEALVVYRHRKGDWFAAIQEWREYPPENQPTHRARLVMIEEIE